MVSNISPGIVSGRVVAELLILLQNISQRVESTTPSIFETLYRSLSPVGPVFIGLSYR